MNSELAELEAAVRELRRTVAAALVPVAAAAAAWLVGAVARSQALRRGAWDGDGDGDRGGSGGTAA